MRIRILQRLNILLVRTVLQNMFFGAIVQFNTCHKGCDPFLRITEAFEGVCCGHCTTLAWIWTGDNKTRQKKQAQPVSSTMEVHCGWENRVRVLNIKTVVVGFRYDRRSENFETKIKEIIYISGFPAPSPPAAHETIVI